MALIPTLALSACNIGKIADGTTVKTLAPGMIASADVSLACASGSALAPVMMALSQGKPLKKQAPKSEALTLIAAGMCAEVDAWEDELTRLQVTYRLSVGADAKSLGPLGEDALIRERRAHVEAARRDYAAYLRVSEVYGAPTETVDCPATLKADDALIFLLGLTAGLLAFVHDTHGLHQVGVPSTLPRQVERGVACLDDARWHRLPSALQAAIWATIPGTAPAGTDPWALLEETARAGEADGLWLARALQVQIAASAGEGQVATLHAAIGAHAAVRGAGPGAPEFGLLNDYAGRMIRHYSDRIWMEARGHRTDSDALGEFPEAPISDADAAEAAAIKAMIAEEAAKAAKADPPATPGAGP